MPWVIGIDEAGYGPNLGPLVQAGVALKLPEDDPAGWRSHPGVRKANESNDGRPMADDSKLVYARGGVSALAMAIQPFPDSLGEILRQFGLPESREELLSEIWFEDRIGSSGGVGPIHFGPRVISTVMPTRFNRILAAYGSKAAVLQLGFRELVCKTIDELPDNDALHIVGDKQGGRNHYLPLLQSTFPDSWIRTIAESADESRYSLTEHGRDIIVTFRPRADSGSLAVALASMMAKYTRELAMEQFNAFWRKQVPDLKPTAGYPLDAKRFYAEIESAMTRLGIPREAVWRAK
jgi:hypothetical protein